MRLLTLSSGGDGGRQGPADEVGEDLAEGDGEDVEGDEGAAAGGGGEFGEVEGHGEGGGAHSGADHSPTGHHHGNAGRERLQGRAEYEQRVGTQDHGSPPRRVRHRRRRRRRAQSRQRRHRCDHRLVQRRQRPPR